MLKALSAAISAVCLGSAAALSTANAAIPAVSVEGISSSVSLIGVPGSVGLKAVNLTGSITNTFAAYLGFDLTAFAPSGGVTNITNSDNADLDFTAINLFRRAADGRNVLEAALSTGVFQNDSIGIIDVGNVSFANLQSGSYVVRVEDLFGSGGQGSVDGTVSTVPLPAALLLFGTALLGLGAMRRRTMEMLPGT